jgi:arginine deiminase
LESVLEKHLHRPITLIRCGGKDQITSVREQWNDGANTLAIAPGKVIVYDRNHVTNQMLKDAGIEVLEIESSELSRGRGGPRCMSMPIEREDI